MRLTVAPVQWTPGDLLRVNFGLPGLCLVLLEMAWQRASMVCELLVCGLFVMFGESSGPLFHIRCRHHFV